jgi:hypothetical protein
MCGFRYIFNLWPVVLAAMVLGLAIRLLPQQGGRLIPYPMT